jgi:hypothetical protein
MDSYSVKQIHGEIGDKNHCENYYSYGQLGLEINAGGYRVNQNAHAHPCGEIMPHILDGINLVYLDSIYLVNQ